VPTGGGGAVMNADGAVTFRRDTGSPWLEQNGLA
jgi:hypothetical protein